MNESDYIQMFWSAQEMGVNALLLYLAVISGYLVVAFVVGADLTRSQTQFVSAIFVVFACYALWASGSTGGRATWRSRCWRRERSASTSS